VATALVIPGVDGSGPDHWQTAWEAARADCRRVDQRDWSDPDPDEWAGALYRAVRSLDGDAVLVAHSLGCLLVDHAAGYFDDFRGRVRGALLVAPCDPERPGARPGVARFAAPARPLPFRAVVVASADDPHCSPERARCFAERWGASLVEAGPIGHVDADSGLGDWPVGQVLLDDLLGRAPSLALARVAQLRRDRLADGLFGCGP